MSQTTIDGVFIFDTTGSMSPCIHQVRKNIKSACEYLYKHVPNLRLGLLSHGDWCDGLKRMISTLDLISVREHTTLNEWIKNNPSTSGGDSDEFYEYAMYLARTSFSWKADVKFAVIIGDANPHTEDDYYGTRGRYHHEKKYFNGESALWEDQLEAFNAGVGPMFPIQALGFRSYNRRGSFWQKIADRQDNVPKLDLEQFSDIHQILMAVCMQQAGKLDEYENSISSMSVSHNVMSSIDSLAGRKKRSKKASRHSTPHRTPVYPSRFQVFDIDEDVSIKKFVEDNCLVFKKGRGFYEFTKRVKVQDYKEVIVRDDDTGEMFSGSDARELLGIPEETAWVSPSDAAEDCTGFVQSTSVNRKLLAGTKFMYEVAEKD